jgi:hypothetical protein
MRQIVQSEAQIVRNVLQESLDEMSWRSEQLRHKLNNIFEFDDKYNPLIKLKREADERQGGKENAHPPVVTLPLQPEHIFAKTHGINNQSVCFLLI